MDFFVLIVNGNAELETGKEKIISEIGSFYYFGVSALYVSRRTFFPRRSNNVRSIFQSPEEKLDDLLRSKSNKFRPFVPDFSLRVSETVQILRIRRVHWLAAVRASYFDKRPTTNSDEQQIVCLIEELEKADLVESNNNGTIQHGRTMSLALTAASDGALAREKFLDDNATTSSTETPLISAKHRPHLFRSRNATTPPAASSSSSSSKLNHERPFGKNRSQTLSTP